MEMEHRSPSDDFEKCILPGLISDVIDKKE
jgi:hypothetical protein